MSTSGIIDSSNGGVQGQLIKNVNIPSNGTLTISTDTSVAGSANDIIVNNNLDTTGSQLRWGIGWNGAEAGANAGSDMFLRNYDDNGTFIANCVSVTRATGAVTIQPGPLKLVSANRSGTFTATSAVPVDVPCTGLTANSVVLLTVKTVAGANAGSCYVSAVVPGASFSARCPATLVDTSVYNYVLIDIA